MRLRQMPQIHSPVGTSSAVWKLSFSSAIWTLLSKPENVGYSRLQNCFSATYYQNLMSLDLYLILLAVFAAVVAEIGAGLVGSEQVADFVAVLAVALVAVLVAELVVVPVVVPVAVLPVAALVVLAVVPVVVLAAELVAAVLVIDAVPVAEAAVAAVVGESVRRQMVDQRSTAWGTEG
jgi:hypothetical protein